MANFVKILILANSLWNVYNFRYDLIRKLIQEGYEIYIIAPIDLDKNNISKLNSKIIDIELKNKNIIKDLFYFFKIAFYFKNIKPDFVLTFNIKSNIYASIINFFFNYKVIPNVTGLGSSFLKKNFQRRITIFLYSFAFKYSYFIFFQNNHDRRFFIKLNIVTKQKSGCIPGSGINLDKYQYNKLLNDNNSFTFIGRLIKDKGIEEFLKVIKIFREKKIDIVFNIVGNFDENNPTSINKKSFYDFIKNYNVNYFSFISEIKEIILKSTAIVLPTYREGMPRVLIESMALGRVVIATDVVGCNELISNNENGILCRVKNISDLYDKILLVKNKSILNKNLIASNARKHVENNFDVKFVINSYMKIIKKKINNKNKYVL